MEETGLNTEKPEGRTRLSSDRERSLTGGFLDESGDSNLSSENLLATSMFHSKNIMKNSTGRTKLVHALTRSKVEE